jgi:hypothetical protein
METMSDREHLRRAILGLRTRVYRQLRKAQELESTYRRTYGTGRSRKKVEAELWRLAGEAYRRAARLPREVPDTVIETLVEVEQMQVEMAERHAAAREEAR